MINCNTQDCGNICNELLNSKCIIVDENVCNLGTCNITSNSCGEVFTMNDYIIRLCNELQTLKLQLKCMTDLYCAPQCNILISNLTVSN